MREIHSGKMDCCVSKESTHILLFSWARLELLAGLLQEVLLVSLSLSIIVDAINKLINPNHIEDPSVMIYLGSAGICIGLLGIFLFRGYHHDHNIRHEIVEQKKNDFLQSVSDTLKNREHDQIPVEQRFIQLELLTNEASSSIDLNEQTRTREDSIIPSLNDTYTNTFLVADQIERVLSKTNEQQLRVPDVGSPRMRHPSGESFLSTTSIDQDVRTAFDDEFQESRVYATLHALCLHSLVKIVFVLID